MCVILVYLQILKIMRNELLKSFNLQDSSHFQRFFSKVQYSSQRSLRQSGFNVVLVLESVCLILDYSLMALHSYYSILRTYCIGEIPTPNTNKICANIVLKKFKDMV